MQFITSTNGVATCLKLDRIEATPHSADAGHERLIVVGGAVSPPVQLNSSVPQGCCHACQAFLIFIEGLAHRIRATTSIEGLRTPY